MAYHVSAAPHVRMHQKSSHIMYLVLLALFPAVLAGTMIFGLRALFLMFVSMASAVLAEALWQKLSKKKVTVTDGSAAVTGLLLALCLPVTLPYWMAALGSVFAVIIAKALFGGLGHNFMNPALCGRAFLLASWPTAMTNWVIPVLGKFGPQAADVQTGATPLAIAKEGSGTIPPYYKLFFGATGGSIGETCVVALLIGAVFLLIMKVITLHIPLSYLGSAAFFGWMFGSQGLFTGDPLFTILSGGICLAAFFMATDYVTSPLTRKGQVIFGIGCGFITIIIRRFGAYPEGVTYAILLMNALTPLIDRFTVRKPFGEGGKKHA